MEPILEQQEDVKTTVEAFMHDSKDDVQMDSVTKVQTSDRNQNVISPDGETASGWRNLADISDDDCHGKKIELFRRKSDDEICDRNLNRPVTSLDRSANVTRAPVIRSRTALGNYYDLNLLVKSVPSEKRRISGISDR